MNTPQRGYGEFARLALRGVVGSVMIAHGLKHARSLDGTARWFSGIGFARPRLQAQMSAAVETASGAALVLGAGTPLAAAAIVGTMAVAARTVHIPNGFFITAEGYEYVLTLATVATAVAVLGPGRYSVDDSLGLAGRLSGVRVGARAAALGVGVASAQLAVFWRRPKPVHQIPELTEEAA